MWRRGPAGLRTEHFLFEPLHPRHNEADFAAWMGSIEQIKATPGFTAEQWGGDGWPYPMTPEANLRDLQEHAEEFERGEAFAYTVLASANGEVIGCLYIDPDEVADARSRFWVRADHAHLEGELERVVRQWLAGPEWGFESVRYPGRE